MYQGDWNELFAFQDKTLESSIDKTELDPSKHSVEKNYEDDPFVVGCDTRLPVLFLSLFMEYSRAFHVPMSVQFNYRKVDVQEILRVKNGTSLYQEIGSGDGMTLSDKPMYVMFYEVTNKHEGRRPEASTDATIVSLCQGNFKVNNSSKYGQVKFDGVVPKHVTPTTYANICKLFNGQASMFQYENNDQKHWFLDWGKAFGDLNYPDGRSVEQTKDFIADIGMKLDLKKYNSNSGYKLYQDLRETIQSITPLRIGFLEGNHRMEAAIRRFYGVPMVESHNLFESKKGGFVAPADASIAMRMNIRIVQTIPCDGMIYKEDLGPIRSLSKKLTYEATSKLVESSWRQYFVDLVGSIKQQAFWISNINDADYYWHEEDVPSRILLPHGESDVHDQNRQLMTFLLDHMQSHDPARGTVMATSSDGKSARDMVQHFFRNYLGCPFTAGLSVFPDFNHIKKNIRLQCFKSINPHALFWLIHVFGTHRESFEALEQFLQSPQLGIHDLEFLMVYVVSPVNHLASSLSKAIRIELQKRQLLSTKKTSKERTVFMSRLQHFIRISFGMEYLHILGKFGLKRTIDQGTTNHVLVEYMTKSDLTYNALSKSEINRKKLLAYQYVTQPILMLWPEYVSIQLDIMTSTETSAVISGWLSNEDNQTLDKWLYIFKELDSDIEEETLEDPLEENDAINCIVPPELRFSEDNFNKIFNGQIDLASHFKAHQFKFGSVTQSPKKKPSRSPHVQTAPSAIKSIQRMIANEVQNSGSVASDTNSSTPATLSTKQFKTFQTISTKLTSICENNEYVGHTKEFSDSVKNFVAYVNKLVPNPEIHQLSKKRKHATMSGEQTANSQDN